MTIRATWNGSTLAESDHTILVEGNHYFPASDVRAEHLRPSGTHSKCPWKGEASYYNVVAEGQTNPDAAWYYPEPFAAAEAVRDYVAFWKGVEVTGANAGEEEVRPPAK